MIVLSVFLAVFIVLLAVALVILLRSHAGAGMRSSARSRIRLGGSRSRQHPDEQSIYAFFAGVYLKRSAES